MPGGKAAPPDGLSQPRPETRIAAPVTARAASEARKATTSASGLGATQRLKSALGHVGAVARGVEVSRAARC